MSTCRLAICSRESRFTRWKGNRPSARRRWATSKNYGAFTGSTCRPGTATGWWRKNMQTSEAADLLADFEAGRVDPAQFPHRAHVRVGFELLQRHAFPEALLHLARGLRALATK